MAQQVFTTTPREMPEVVPGLLNPIIEDRYDMCPICRSQRIELISFNGYPQHYRDAVNAYLSGHNVAFDRYEIRAMKCQACGKEFAIDWSTGFPRPLRDNYRAQAFVAEFMMGI